MRNRVCEPAGMVLEVAQIPVTPGREEAFVAAYREAVAHLSASAGFGSARMLRGIESPSQFVLLVEWESVAAHEAFRAGEGFPAWRALIGPHFAGPPSVEHFADV